MEGLSASRLGTPAPRIQISDGRERGIAKICRTPRSNDAVALNGEGHNPEHQVLDVLCTDIKESSELGESLTAATHVAHDLGEETR